MRRINRSLMRSFSDSRMAVLHHKLGGFGLRGREPHKGPFQRVDRWWSTLETSSPGPNRDEGTSVHSEEKVASPAAA